MKSDVEIQLRNILEKTEKITESANCADRAQIYGYCSGFLAGLKLTGVINGIEYNKFYDEIIKNTYSMRILA